jgi:Fe-S cluster assembly protein SufD
VPEAAKLRVYEEFISARGDSPDGAWNNTLTQLKLGPLGDCGYYRVLSSPGSFHTGAVTAVLDKGSRLETVSLTAGARLARINVNVHFKAPDAECFLDGLYLTRGNEHVDHHTTVDHEVGHCRSHQLYKGILSDQSRAVFNGKVFIRKDAQSTEAYQTNKNLLLSREAEVDTKPQLEIDANDVKASHGAAIGSINPAELFYLQSRCISKADAMAMLCRGFADDVVMRVTDDTAKFLLTSRVRDWFKTQTISVEVVS